MMVSIQKQIFFLMIVACLFFPQTAFAHASLIQALPSPDTQLDKSPNQVILTFNERLENELFYIKILNENGKSATVKKAKITDQQTKIRLDLPELPDGTYTVTYKAISADGHPVAESYVFTVGQKGLSQPPKYEDSFNHQNGLSSNRDIRQIITYVSSIAYYLSLLLLIGWTFWGITVRSIPEDLQKALDLCSLNLQRFFMLSLLVMITFHLEDYIEQWDFEQITSFFFGTATGISWLSSLLLSLVGFLLLHRSKWTDGLWISFMLLAKSINGHAMAIEPPIRTIILDVIHLFAAAVWAGGLFYIIKHWRKYKGHILNFLPQFSSFAFASMIVLAVSGAISTLIYLPKLKYVLYTQWGILLITKCVLVILVIIVGAILRYLMKRKKQLLGTILKMDFSLMMLIVVIVSIFTYLNPQPLNSPLSWHEMGEKVHLTTKITPNAPGDNTFSVVLYVSEKLSKPKTVRLFLKYKDDKDVAPIEVPLAPFSGDQVQSFPGFTQYSFLCKGPYLPFPGAWNVEIRLLDANDDETVYQKEMMIY